MKLAIIRRRYNPFGGAERFIERLIPRLQSRRIEATILTEDWTRKTGGARIDTVVIRGITRTQRFYSFNQSVVNRLHLLKEQKQAFDLVQSHERVLGANIFRLGDGVHAAWIKRLQQESGRLRSAWIGVDPFHRAVMQTERKMAQDLQLFFVANSELVAREVREYLGVAEHRIQLIPNGVDTVNFFSPSDSEKESARREIARATDIWIAPGMPVVTIIGSGFTRKGVFQLIQACSQVQDFVLLICGADKEAWRVRALIEKFGLKNRVALTGPLHDVRPLLWASDFFCLPSLYDPSSNAVLEALACGLPVMVTRDVGMAQEISDAGAGIICERSDASLIHGLSTLRDPQVRAQMAQHARTFALRFDQDLVIDQWLNFYQGLKNRVW